MAQLGHTPKNVLVEEVACLENSHRVRAGKSAGMTQYLRTRAFLGSIILKSKELCDKVRNGWWLLEKQAKITSKGQITIPREVRRALGVQPGDRLLFESDERGMRVRPARAESPFARYRGIGNLGIRSGRKEIVRWVREMRGHDDGH